MSSSMNNNSLTPSVATATNQEFTASRSSGPSTMNSNKPQRYYRDQSSNSSHRGRHRRGGSRGGPLQRHDAQLGEPSIRLDADANRSTEECKPGQHSVGRRRGGRGPSGKYRQRQQTNQLLEGIDGLDIDLVESVAPTITTDDNTSTTTRHRHATNTRKVNLTHLLNYNYERKNKRQTRNHSYNDNSDTSSYTRSNYHQYKSPYKEFDVVHKFNKQQFLQANCQFVVLDGHDYTVHKVDSDWPVDWDCIEEIKFKQSASTETTCPICLDPPIAAKITRCGHIYCWACMLHYLSLSDDNCRQCPICFEAVYKTDLRSVVSHSFDNYSVGEEIVMRLMVRKKGCVEVEPYIRGSSPSYFDGSDLPKKTRSDSSIGHYCSQDKLVIVDPSTVIEKIIQRERNELMFKLDLEGDAPEVCFIEQALDWLDKRVAKLNELMATNRKVNTCTSNLAESSKSYLFYQCIDGQHIYLNPFSTKMMCHEYSSMENCPLEIRAKILQMDWVSMSEGWRKRFKYLEHLPLTCEFRLIEIDFDKSNLVSRETYKAYEEKILARAKERERRLREERKREKIIQVEQNRRIYGIQPTLDIDLNSIDQFPTVSDERYLGLSRPLGNARAEFGWSDEEEGEVDRISNGGSSGLSQSHAGQAFNDLREDSNRSDEISEANAITSKMTLSFAEIQLQEAAKAAALAKTSKASGSWSAKQGKISASGPCGSSSFAKMVVDAKANQKGWTRSAGSTTATQQLTQSQIVSSHNRHHRTRRSTESDNDDEEELRAPPCEFTITDFMETNVVSGSSKKKSAKSKKRSAK